MFNGELKNTIDVNKLNISMLENSISFFKEKTLVCNIHDISPIRKPESQKLDSLGLVKDLENGVIPGYETFNSVMVDRKSKELRFLSSTPFSNGDSKFVGVKERKSYEKGLLEEKRRAEIEQYDLSSQSFNQNDVIKGQLRQISKAIKTENPSLTVIDLFDRGFDSNDLFALEAELGHEFITRLKGNRNSNEVYMTENSAEKAIKLKDQFFMKGEDLPYKKISFKERIYLQAKGVFQWDNVEIAEKTYSVLRVEFYQRNGVKIFKDPMLLLTSLNINNLAMAQMVWELYMQRMKIESVFRFCKQELKWESPRIDDWQTMQNLLTFIYFVAGYFYEVEHELKNDPTVIWIAQLARSKGKVTPHFIIKGLGIIAGYIQVQKMIKEGIFTESDIQELAKNYLIL
jgi:hypothetical protein